MKAVLWITVLVFGSLFGLSMGLFVGVIFGLSITVGLDVATATNGAGTNAVPPPKAMPTVDLALNDQIAAAASR